MSVKELMTNLADSVRLKTGLTEKMTLEQIAAAITSITVEGDIGFTCGTYTPSATGAKTIEHGLGQVPGAVIFVKMAAPAGTATTSSGTIRDALLSIVYGKEVGHSYCYHYSYKASSSSTATTTRYWSNSSSVPSTMFGSDASANTYYVTNINETSFKTPSALISGKKYLWIAFRAPLA